MKGEHTRRLPPLKQEGTGNSINITKLEVEDILKTLDKKKSQGPDK